MRSHNSPFADLKSAAQQQAATTAGRPVPFAAVPESAPAAPQTAESAPMADSGPKEAAPTPAADSSRRRSGSRPAAGSAASEIAALRQQPRQQIIDVNGFRVTVPASEVGRVVATTVQLPYELREAVREAEQLTGRSYQHLARLGLKLVLEQLSGHQPADTTPNQ